MLWHYQYLLVLIPCGIAVLSGWIAWWANWAIKDEPTPLRAMLFFGVGIGFPAALVITLITHFAGI